MGLSQDLADLRTRYGGLRESLDSLCNESKEVDSRHRSEIWSLEFIDETTKQLVSFLRSIETAAMDALALADNKTLLLATRTRIELNRLRVAFDGRSAVIDNPPQTFAKEVATTLGILTGSNQGNGKKDSYSILGLLDRENFCAAATRFQRLRSTVFSLLDDISLFYSLKLLPMEERAKIRQQLADLDWDNLAGRLTKAEEDFVGKDFKGCIGLCETRPKAFLEDSLQGRIRSSSTIRN